MPLCEGRPDGSCSDKRNDSSVRLSQGDLMLCPGCDAFRFPPSNGYAPKSRDVRNDPPSIQVREVTTESENKPLKNVAKPASVKLEVSDAFCFVKSKYDNHPVTIIKETICDFFREEEILLSKELLIHAVNEQGINIKRFLGRELVKIKSRQMWMTLLVFGQLLMKLV